MEWNHIAHTKIFCVCVCVCPRRFSGCLVAVFQASNCFGKSYVEKQQPTLLFSYSHSKRADTHTAKNSQMHNARSLIVILKRNYILWESWKKQPNQFECRLISSCFILPSFWQFRLRFIKVNMKTFRYTRREMDQSERDRDRLTFSFSISIYVSDFVCV